MKRVAFIGLGVMGLPMAANLLASGFDVVGCNRSRHRVDEFVRLGGLASESTAQAVASADIVITMLPDSPDVQAVVLGPNGVLANAAPGTLLIEMSTIRPDVARAVAERGLEVGVRVLDAPVSGGEQGAIDGTLSIMVGGSPQDFQAAMPILEALGTTIVHVGDNGAGQTVKAANQLIVAGTIELVSEALVFLDALGVDLESAVSVLAGGLAGNAIFARKVPAMLDRNFDPGFRVDLHHKDLSIMLDAARLAGVSIPLGTMVASLVGSLRAQGHGSLDHSALLLQVEQLSGRVRVPSSQTVS